MTVNLNKGRRNRVAKYIDEKIKVNNFFPYEPKNRKKNDNKEDIDTGSRDILNILNQISNLNIQIKNYSKRNKERDSKISISIEEECNDDCNNDKESKTNMDIK